MALVVIPQTEAATYADLTLSPNDRAQKVSSTTHLGAGILRPFRRDEKRDFANSGGVDNVKACVGQILGMVGANPNNPVRQGELYWAPERGSLIHLLNHQKNTIVLQELGRVYVVDALRRWEPRVRIRSVRITLESGDEGVENILLVRLFYDVVAVGQGNQVLFPNVEQTLSQAG
jgi:hypothetical protein